MKRKIIKQGIATLTISLPAKWTKQFKLNAGDEVELSEQGKNLVVSTGQTARPVRETIDLNQAKGMPRLVTTMKYIKGCDEINAKICNREQAQQVQERVRALQGLEIVEQTKNELLIKDITEQANVQLDPLIRRVFHMLNTLGQESLTAFKHKETDVSYLEDLEQSINRFTHLCLRTINKQGMDNISKTTATYTICFFLEAIADEFKEVLQFTRINKLQLSNASLEIYSDLLYHLKQFEELFYDFNLEKANTMAKTYDKILHKIKTNLTKKTPKDTVVLMHFKNILEFLIWAMNQKLVSG
ncbi:hypothetical protein COV18_04085 [Candidatus Woesearchaeota archaeon CG10_big_fil_rev_8_21_14_0_10_37_12]|nr:MAG: hypothetical protein COV18_04085 [Candidatus Woesearchaeota archaeon CG10_big_fil_rev_8_21_14_0_10_37_12]